MYYDTAIYWNKADTNGVNRDSLLVIQALTVRGRVLMAVLCDGAGEMGEYAGAYLTKKLMDWFYDGLPKALVSRNPLSVIKRHVERTIYRTQRRIYEYAETHETEYCGTEDFGVKKQGASLKTAVSLLILWEKKYMLWNFGDNHVYSFSPDGRMKYSQADFETGAVKNKDVFFICSNTFIHRISENEIEDVLAPNELTMERCRRRLKEIGETAMRKGERGSMSAVCVRISSRKRKDINYKKL